MEGGNPAPIPLHQGYLNLYDRSVVGKRNIEINKDNKFL